MFNRNKLETDAISRYSNEDKLIWESKAKNLLDDNIKMKKMLKKAVKKLDERKHGPFRQIFNNINFMILLLKDYISGEYRQIPYVSILMITASIIYFVVPIDFLPDFIVSLGFVDDLAIITLTLKQIDSDLEKYKDWRENRK